MSLDDATRIVTRLGPTTIALDRAAEPALALNLARLGCLVRGPGEPAAVALVRGMPGAVAADTLVVIPDGAAREAIETPLLAAGWRRHPAGLLAEEAGDWGAERLPRLAFYQRRPAAGLLGGGVEADAPIARFALAAGLVRSGDRVLVGGIDAEAGAAIVAALSRAGTIVAADGEPLAVLAAEPARSLDALILVAEAVAPALAAAAERALKADGRLLLAWREDGGEAAVEEHFIVDRRIGQPDGWTLLVASADPIAGAAGSPAYHHPAFHRGEVALSVLVDFAAAYDNPHLYRTMVQLGERLGDELVLARLAECVIEDSAPGSADRGAAIAVLGYRVLDLGLIASVPPLTALIDGWLAVTERSKAPHVLRWRLSLLFLAGRLAEIADAPDEAIGRFHAASLADWAGFSPILATKAIAAAYHEARLHLATGARAAALACFRRGLDTALAAAAAPHRELIGDPAAPVPFYLQEMAEVMDMGGQCANALHHAHLLDRDPGLFWRQVDTKRFGLFAWADALHREHRSR